jgi:hypothetical protein
LADEFSLDEIVAVEIGGDIEGQEGGHAQHHGSRTDRECRTVMGVAAALLAQDSVIGIIGRDLGWRMASRSCSMLLRMK